MSDTFYASIPAGLVQDLRSAGHTEMANHLVNLGAAINGRHRRTMQMAPVGDPVIGVAMAYVPTPFGETVNKAVTHAMQLLGR